VILEIYLELAYTLIIEKSIWSLGGTLEDRHPFRENSARNRQLKH